MLLVAKEIIIGVPVLMEELGSFCHSGGSTPFDCGADILEIRGKCVCRCRRMEPTGVGFKPLFSISTCACTK